METDHGRIVGEVAGVVVGVAASGGGAGGGAKLAPPIDVRVERVERTEASGDEEVEDGEKLRWSSMGGEGQQKRKRKRQLCELEVVDGRGLRWEDFEAREMLMLLHINSRLNRSFIDVEFGDQWITDN